MNENKEVSVWLPQNYKLAKQFNIPWLKIIEASVVVFPLMYFLWTINFTMTIKIIGTIFIGLPLLIILLIGHRGKSIGQVILLSIFFSQNKIRLHLRSVNDEKAKSTEQFTSKNFDSISEKIKDITQRFVK